MPETTIQTAIFDNGLKWSTDPEANLGYAVGKHRAKIFLGADLVASYADHSVRRLKDECDTAMAGWIKTLHGVSLDETLTDAQKKRKGAEVEKEFLRAKERKARLEELELDKYLYDLVRAVFLADAEFGQLTHLVKKDIGERKRRKGAAVLVENWRNSFTSDGSTPLMGVRVSVRGSDLMTSVFEATGAYAPGLTLERFLEARIVPFTWLLNWLTSIDALEVEMMQSSLRVSKAMADWEEKFDADLRQMNRDIISRACAIKGLMDSIDLDQGQRKGVVQLKLRDGFVSTFLASFREFQDLADRMARMKALEQAGLVVVGMGGSGKTTFLRRCYELLKDDYGNTALNEDIDPKSTAFVVGHVFRDIEVPLFNGSRKRMTLCWMDTAGSEDYRLLGQQLTISVREQRKKVFTDRPVDYNLLFVWSCEPSYDPVKDVKGFESVFSRFLEEVQNLAYFELEPPAKIFLLLNKADNAERSGIAPQFKADHERAFLTAMNERGEGLQGESLGFVSALNVDRGEISKKLLVAIFGLSDDDWAKAFSGIKLGINQSIVGNLLPPADAQRFKAEVYDAHATEGPEGYFSATIGWIDRYLAGTGKEQPVSTRALLSSLRSFLSEVREGDEVAQDT